jgi:hypothetical protein
MRFDLVYLMTVHAQFHQKKVPTTAEESLVQIRVLHLHTLTQPERSKQTLKINLIAAKHLLSSYSFFGLSIYNRLTTKCEAFDTHFGLTYQKLVNYSTPCSQSFNHNNGITAAQCHDPNLNPSTLPGAYAISNMALTAPIATVIAVMVLLVGGISVYCCVWKKKKGQRVKKVPTEVEMM